jgi:isopentenyl phosphate kinase
MNPLNSAKKIIFLKLGGSLITDKHTASTARMDMIERTCGEIAQALTDDPKLQLVLGHGSGSFGHMAAKEFNTRQGVSTPEEWRGFSRVWKEARALNQIMIEALQRAGLPALSFPASAGAAVANGVIQTWDIGSLSNALDSKLLPVVYGDVAFDKIRGGTILSTEDIFKYLARHLYPKQIMLAGIEPGVWADYPACNQLAPTITPTNLNSVLPALQGSAAADVTGGMRSKVEEMLSLVQEIDTLEVVIFSGEEEGSILRALQGNAGGTRISAGD